MPTPWPSRLRPARPPIRARPSRWRPRRSSEGPRTPVDARTALVEGSQALAAPPSCRRARWSRSVTRCPSSSLPTGRSSSPATATARSPRGARRAPALARDVPGHTKAIEEMDITPDGRSLVSGSDDASVMLWDLTDPADVPAPTRARGRRPASSGASRSRPTARWPPRRRRTARSASGIWSRREQIGEVLADLEVRLAHGLVQPGRRDAAGRERGRRDQRPGPSPTAEVAIPTFAAA